MKSKGKIYAFLLNHTEALHMPQAFSFQLMMGVSESPLGVSSWRCPRTFLSSVAAFSMMFCRPAMLYICHPGFAQTEPNTPKCNPILHQDSPNNCWWKSLFVPHLSKLSFPEKKFKIYFFTQRYFSPKKNHFCFWCHFWMFHVILSSFQILVKLFFTPPSNFAVFTPSCVWSKACHNASKHSGFLTSKTKQIQTVSWSDSRPPLKNSICSVFCRSNWTNAAWSDPQEHTEVRKLDWWLQLN